MSGTENETYIESMIGRFRHSSPRPRDEREPAPEPFWKRGENDSYSLNQSSKNPLDDTNLDSSLTHYGCKEIPPLNEFLDGRYNDSGYHPAYDNQINDRDEFGSTGNRIIQPSSIRYVSSPDLNASISIDFGVTKSSIKPPLEISPEQEEYKNKLLAELDDDNENIPNPIPLTQSQQLNPIINNNNIYPADGLPVTMSPPQFSFTANNNNNNNIQESKYDIVYNNNNYYNNENKDDMKTTSSQIIEGLDVVMLPFKKKMIKQDIATSSSLLLLPELEMNNNNNGIITTTTTKTTIDPPTLQPLDNNDNDNQLPILSQPLLINRSNNNNDSNNGSIEPPDSISAMKKSIESNIPIIQIQSTGNINPPINNNNNNNNTYFYPPSINPLQQSYDDNNVKEIDQLIQQLKEENDRIKPTHEFINDLNIDRELSDSDDDNDINRKLKPIKQQQTQYSSSPSLNLLNHNNILQPQLYPQPQIQPPPPSLNYNQQIQLPNQQIQQQNQIPFNSYISPPSIIQPLPSAIPVYGESKVINSNTNNNSNNNNMIGSLGNVPIYQAGTTNPSVILATSIRSQPLVTNGIPIPDSTPYINPITAQSIATTISPPLLNQPIQSQPIQTAQTQQPVPATAPQTQQEQKQPSQPPTQQPSQMPTPSTRSTLPPVIISGIPVSSPRIFDAQPLIPNTNTNINTNTVSSSFQPNYQPQYLPSIQPSQLQFQNQNPNIVPCYQKPLIHSITPVSNMNITSLYPSSLPSQQSQLPVSTIIPTISPPLPPLVPTSTNNDLKTIPIHPNQFQYVINTIGPNGMIQSTPYTLSDSLSSNVQPIQQTQGPPIAQPLYSSRSNISHISENNNNNNNNMNMNDQSTINRNVTEKLKSVLDKSAEQRRKFQAKLS